MPASFDKRLCQRQPEPSRSSGNDKDLAIELESVPISSCIDFQADWHTSNSRNR